jgi:hypothetical protein
MVHAVDFDLMSRMGKFHFEHPSYGLRRLGVQFEMSRYHAKRLM